MAVAVMAVMAVAVGSLYRLAWLAHAATPVFARKVAQAQKVVCAALELGTTYISISGGKDSVSLYGVARSVCEKIPAYWINSGAESQHTIDVIAKLGDVNEELPELSIVQMMRQIGALGHRGGEYEGDGAHWLNSDWKRILIDEPASRIMARLGAKSALVGMRADESRQRGMLLRSRGPIYQRGAGDWIACPLSGWSGLDSLAYAASKGLPISRLYTDPGATPPEKRRTGSLLGGSARTIGRIDDLRRSEPDIYRALVVQFPGLSRY